MSRRHFQRTFTYYRSNFVGFEQRTNRLTMLFTGFTLLDNDSFRIKSAKTSSFSWCLAEGKITPNWYIFFDLHVETDLHWCRCDKNIFLDPIVHSFIQQQDIPRNPGSIPHLRIRNVHIETYKRTKDAKKGGQFPLHLYPNVRILSILC